MSVQSSGVSSREQQQPKGDRDDPAGMSLDDERPVGDEDGQIPPGSGEAEEAAGGCSDPDRSTREEAAGGCSKKMTS